MSGLIIFGIGCAMIVFSVVLFAAAVVYSKTTGKRMKKELEKEYIG